MKKIVWGALILFVLVAGVLLALAKDPVKEVTILSFRQDHSRVITSAEETFGVVLLMDVQETFLTDSANIRSTRLVDESQELAVSTSSVESAGKPVDYQGKTFFPFRFNLSFSEVFSSDLSLSFPDANLEITYENETILSFPLGSVRLTFDELDNPGHMEWSRLFGVSGSEGGEEILTGIVIGVKSNVSSPLVLRGISILTEGARADFGEVICLSEAPERTRPVEEILRLPDYESVRSILPEESGILPWPGDGLWFIPIVHLGEGRYLFRFPIVITYSYLDVEYRYVVDDFLFFSPEIMPEVLVDDVVQTVYRY